MCKKAQNRAKSANIPKIAQKAQKHLIKRLKISTGGAAAAAIFFHLWVPNFCGQTYVSHIYQGLQGSKAMSHNVCFYIDTL